MSASHLSLLKALLRIKIRSLISAMKPAERKRKSRRIEARLLKDPHFKKADSLLIYASLPAEVETGDLIRRALQLKKKVFVPCLDKKRGHMSAFRILSVRELKKGAFGILEPSARTQGRRLGRGQADLAVVPGLGFSPQGIRLGRGYGYFDRYLEKIKPRRTVGLAFKEQLFRAVPAESHDAAVDRVVTD